LRGSSLSADDKNNLLLESISAATAKNLACYFDAWGFPVSAALRTQLNQYGVNPICLDQDQDGFTPLQGDFNDNAASIRPGATEVLNGLDDDCNGVVDDVLVNESNDFPNTLATAQAVAVPSRIAGTNSAANDPDHFSLTLNTTKFISFTLQPKGTFKGWLFLYQQGTTTWYKYIYAGTQASELKIELGPGKWNFEVAQNNASSPGPYEVTIKESYVWPAVAPTATVSSAQPNRYALPVPSLPAALATLPNLKARFWLSGYGWVGQVSNAANLVLAGQAEAAESFPATFTWVAPCNTNVAAMHYRVQFLADDLPVQGVTAPGTLVASAGSGPCQIRLAKQVLAANYSEQALAPEALASAFGPALSAQTLGAAVQPLPLTLAETTVRVRDNAGVERPAPLLFVSPTQINYQVPAGTGIGPALVTITRGDGEIAQSTISIATTTPGLFSVDVTGKGFAAAVVQRVAANGTSRYEPVVKYDPLTQAFVALPITVSSSTEQVFLILFGTGFRSRNSLFDVRVTVAGLSQEVVYAGAQGEFAGLDQVNLKLSPTLAGKGVVTVQFTVAGTPANPVQISVK
jgi:uncharacterized protein (TIGR03437 family)